MLDTALNPNIDSKRKSLISCAVEWIDKGRDVAVATVVATWGSSPRPVGSNMIIDQDCNFLGSVSGGCVENTVIDSAIGVISAGCGKLLEFGVSDEMAWSIGLSCGGKIQVYVSPAIDHRMLVRIEELEIERCSFGLITDIDTGCQGLIIDGNLDDGQDLGPLPLEIFWQNVQAGMSGFIPEAERLFLQTFLPPRQLVIVGAVHIAQHLVRMASELEYHIKVVDPRGLWANGERFHDELIIHGWPQDVEAILELSSVTAVVVLSHDPKIDDRALEMALRSDVFYIGALGSNKSHAKRLERMRALGFGDDLLARIHGPIGLDIGAKSPSEIAVSILAEITLSANQNQDRIQPL